MQTIRKQNLLAAALALAAVQSALPVSAGEPAAKRYNVLLIIRDQEQGSLLAARGDVFRHHLLARES